MKKNYTRSILFLAYFGLLLVAGSCEMIDYSPHQVKLADDELNLNDKYAKQIEALGLKSSDTIRFALISDTQRFYDETEKFVDDINARTELKGKRIDFVMHGGDYTDFGLMEEYRWIHNILKRLKMPYLTVIGNHDCTANGRKIYQKMFGPIMPNYAGPLDFTFQVAGNRFIFMNTNSQEFDESIIHLDYLEQNLKDRENYTNAFVISHVAPFDEDFEDAMELPYARIMKKYDVKYSIHGHKHSYRYEQLYDDERPRYLTIGSVDKYKYVVVTVIGNKVSHEVISYK